MPLSLAVATAQKACLGFQKVAGFDLSADSLDLLDNLLILNWLL
jgi:hypothetical protein